MSVARTSRPGRRLLRRLVKWLAVLVITLAALVAGLRLAFPWWVADPARVERLLGQRLNAPVSIRSSEAQVLGATPLLHLRGLRVGEGDEALLLEEVDLELDLAALVLPWRPVIADLRLSGVQIELRQTSAGLRVRGLPVPRVPFDGLVWADRVGQLSLRGAQVRYRHDGLGVDVASAHVDARLQRRDGVWRFGLRSDEGLRVAGQFDAGAAQPLQVWVGARRMPLQHMQQSWFGLRPVDGQLELDLRAGLDRQGSWDINGRVTLEDLIYEGRAFDLPEEAGRLQPRQRLSRLELGGRAWSAADGSWQLPELSVEVDGQRGQAALDVRSDGAVRLALGDIELGPLLQLLGAATLLPEAVSARIYDSQAGGRLRELNAWLGAADWSVQAHVEHLRLRSADPRVPGVSGLDLGLRMDPQAAWFQLDGSSVELSWPLTLRAPVQLELQAIGSAIWPQGQVQLELDEFTVASGAAAAIGNLRLALVADGSPELDLQAKVLRGDVHTAKQFWIINKMPPKAVEWLDRALVDGVVEEGGIVFRGPLGKPHWPFREQQGRLDAWARLRDATLDYHADWPRAEQLQATVQFINDGMWVQAAAGRVAGTPIAATGALPWFKEPVLALDLDARADAAAWLNFLRVSPVGTRFGSQLVGMQASGAVNARAKVVLPLKRTLGEATLDGVAQLQAVDFRDSRWLLDFRQLQGKAQFTREGFLATDLKLQTAAGSGGRLDLAVGMTADAEKVVEASLSGEFSAQDLFGQHEALQPLLLHMDGKSQWQLELGVPTQRDGVSTLSVYSGLVGTTIGLPQPLGKAAQTRRNLAMRMEFPLESGQPLELSIDDSARARVRLASPRQPFAAVVRVGPGQIQAPLPAVGMFVEGSLQDDEPGRWLELVAGFSAGAQGGEHGLAGVAVELLRPAGPNGHLRAGHDQDKNWKLDIDSLAAAGEVLWTGVGDRSSVTADFTRLHLPRPQGDSDALRDVQPGQLPTLHLRAQDFRVGESRLGQLRLETFPTAAGLRVDLLETRSAHLDLRGSGTWESRGGQQHSRFDLRFSADDLGKMLATLGFAGPVGGGQTLATINAAWKGAPTGFSLERLDGQLDVWVGRGRFLEVEPGAGRLFGLLSFTELPRRLALDFRDFFQSGMAFDEIRGMFTLAEGNAWTQDLQIKAPAAQILIIGRTGVATRDYDQQMIVTPKVGGVLPLVGAIAGGPGGAAAGLVAQGVLARDRDAFLREYRIGGTWDKPSILRQDLPRTKAAPSG